MVNFDPTIRAGDLMTAGIFLLGGFAWLIRLESKASKGISIAKDAKEAFEKGQQTLAESLTETRKDFHASLERFEVKLNEFATKETLTGKMEAALAQIADLKIEATHGRDFDRWMRNCLVGIAASFVKLGADFRLPSERDVG